MKIVWDEPKRHANLAKHGLDFAAVDIDFARVGGEAYSLVSLRPASVREKATALSEKKHSYSEADLAEVGDNPEWTAQTTARSRSFAETFPGTAAAVERTHGQQKAPMKQLVSLRLDQDVVAAFKAGGRGWQVRMGAALRKAAGL